MKRLFFNVLTISLLFGQCTGDNELSPQKDKIDFDQASIQLMEKLAPQIVGTWTLQRVQVKYQNYNTSQRELQITKDTTLSNLATLTIVPAAVPRSSPRDLRRGEYDGTIRYGNRTYPVQFDVRSNPGWIVDKKGPQGYFLFEYRFPDGTHKVEPEEAFLQNIGLISDNFSLETTSDPKKMIWRGLNRGIDQIELVRQ